MSQTLRPVSTLVFTGGTVVGANLAHDALSESSADDLTSYVSQAVNGNTFTVGLGTPASTPATNAITLTYRSLTNVLGIGTFTLDLYCGTTLLGTGTVTPTASFADATVSYSPASVADWSDLRVKVTANITGGLATLRSTQLYATVADGATALSARSGRAARMLVNTCSIQRGAETQAATGESVKQFTTLYSAVPCNIQTRDGSEEQAYARETGKRIGRVYVSPGTDLLNGDRLVSIAGGGASGFTGATLAITGPAVDHAGRGAYLMAPWEEVLGGPTT